MGIRGSMPSLVGIAPSRLSASGCGLGGSVGRILPVGVAVDASPRVDRTSLPLVAASAISVSQGFAKISRGFRGGFAGVSRAFRGRFAQFASLQIDSHGSRTLHLQRKVSQNSHPFHTFSSIFARFPKEFSPSFAAVSQPFHSLREISQL